MCQFKGSNEFNGCPAYVDMFCFSLLYDIASFYVFSILTNNLQMKYMQEPNEKPALNRDTVQSIGTPTCVGQMEWPGAFRAHLAAAAHVRFKPKSLSRVVQAVDGSKLKIAAHEAAASKQQSAAADRYGRFY